ncbi:MAG: DinB family protein [Candidatus Acidiferrales bacterium]
MSDARNESLLDALLDSWDRNNTILTNLVRALPAVGLDASVMESSPSVAQMLTHIHYVRMVFVSDDAPEFLSEPAPDFVERGPEGEWVAERDREQIVQMLNESATVVRDAVKGRLTAGREMDLHYDHPIFMLQHMIWHEGYHHGQIKLALKLAGTPLANADIGPLTWRIWMQKKSAQ